MLGSIIGDIIGSTHEWAGINEGEAVMSRKAIWLGVLVGSTVGGFVPSLWHSSVFSLSGVICSTIGGLVGIWAVHRWMS